MKRIASTNSLGAMISMCPNTEEGNCHVYGRDFQSMLEGLDEEGCVEEFAGQMGEKKRRLSVEQVKALEKNFEVENKLEPERKVKLAHELGLQPRQVAVWFQNRRARWKTKQLERDYGVLKANYDALKANFERLQHDNETLHKELRELKSKLDEDEDDEEEEEDNNRISNVSVKEEAMVLDIKHTGPLATGTPNSVAGSDNNELNYENFNGELLTMATTTASTFFSDLKDGSSDSDSSAILNDDNNNNNNNCSPNSSPAGALQSHRFISPAAGYQPQFVKIEEHNFLGGDDVDVDDDETCNFFSDDQAPELQWYCQEQWN